MDDEAPASACRRAWGLEPPWVAKVSGNHGAALAGLPEALPALRGLPDLGGPPDFGGLAEGCGAFALGALPGAPDAALRGSVREAGLGEAPSEARVARGPVFLVVFDIGRKYTPASTVREVAANPP